MPGYIRKERERSAVIDHRVERLRHLGSLMSAIDAVAPVGEGKRGGVKFHDGERVMEAYSVTNFCVLIDFAPLVRTWRCRINPHALNTLHLFLHSPITAIAAKTPSAPTVLIISM